MADETSDQATATERPALFDAPKDVPAKDATGYAVYDRTLGRFQGEVHHGTSKPSDDDAKAVVREGHQYAIVRV